MSATASAGVGDWYLSLQTYRFKCDKSMHIGIRSVPFLGVTTMGAHHSVTSVTGAIIPWSWSRFSSAFNLSLYANGIDRGVLTQKGSVIYETVLLP